MKKHYACENMNGSQTGSGTATQRPDGRWDVECSFGSPFAGHVCDDGPRYSSIVDDPDRWMQSYRLAQIGRLESFGHISDEEVEANGEFVALAVNSYYDMLAACREALLWTDQDSPGGEACNRQISAAIAKATGGASNATLS